ncbi:type VI secretion system accessory protein TagJ [Nevskia sp.]|uniref:type VI secretion system accessory protein TagJ n=1 Tax=Nevskia sp. TaxID=1929292 RepID=UPI0025D21282|nr:type VI secretion system accessory protein TagJ [Nevskia sp.]
MTPEVKLKEGQLDEALKLLTAQVRSNPADARRRVFLFQLLALTGNWDRARTQLKVAGDLDAMNAMLVGAYNSVMTAELQRLDVFAGKRSPTIIGEPDQWLACLLQALQFDSAGQHAQAAPLREQAFDGAAAVSGDIDGQPFEWLADADPRFGPCLEIIVNGGYSWVPFSRISQLKFEAPSDLRDKVWTPVQVTYVNGGQVVGFVPSRYPGSEASSDSDIVLARKTDWLELVPDLVIGSGQRMFASDVGEYPMLDVRVINFLNN